MSKKQAIWIIIIAVLLGWLFNVFAGRILTAKLSTWPILNKWKILSPQAPIVINNHETVRVSDSGDIAAAADDVKSKISSIVLVNGSSITFSGTAINLTSDGSFVTAAGSFKPKALGVYYVVLNDGTFAKISQQTVDPATSLVFFNATLSGVPAANLDPSSGVLVGDKVLFAQDSLEKFNIRTISASVSQVQADVEGQTFESDFPGRSFFASSNASLAPGEAVVDTNGNIVGIWNGFAVVSSDVLKQAMALFFNNSQNIIRPSFGFSYSIITQSDSQLISLPEGALVKTVAVGSPARLAGLEINDVITSVNGQAVSEDSPLEPMLEQFKPGDQMALAVTRKNQTVNLSLTVGQLK
jgi:S1-C subfamily serine protease